MQQKDELRSLNERVGIYVQAEDSLDAVARIREAELAGVRQIWMSTGGAGFADVLTMVAGVVTQTERVRLGTAIVPAYSRHPLVMAQQALAIHDLAPDRLRLGIGSGDRFFLESRYGLTQTAPLRYLKEYLEIVRGVLWEGSVDYHGEFFQVADTLSRTARVPLLIPALGLKAFRLAGEIADGVLPSLCPVPYLLNQALPALRSGSEARDRPVPPVIACLPVALSTDEPAVLAATRQQMQWSVRISTYARMFAQAGFAGAVNGDEEGLNALARSLVISGDEMAVRDRIQELLAGGLDELLLFAMPIADEEKERKQLLHLIGNL